MKTKDAQDELLRINTILSVAWSHLMMDTPQELEVHEARVAISNLRARLGERSEEEQAPLADYIMNWLITRNRGELAETFVNMRVRDYDCLKGELRWILKHGGKPPNWV
jgi:hypothetical protein